MPQRILSPAHVFEEVSNVSENCDTAFVLIRRRQGCVADDGAPDPADSLRAKSSRKFCGEAGARGYILS
jgi:hypothetical protein